MANETVYSSAITVAAYIDAAIAPVLRAANVMLGVCHTVNFDSGSNAKKLRAKNGQTAAVVSEATSATVAAYSQTSPNTLTAQKIVVLNELSEEAAKFAGLSLQELAEEQGKACAEKIDTDVLALFAGFSNSVGVSGSDLTVAQLVQAAYTVRAANAGGPLVYVLHPIQTFDVQTAIVTAGAPMWSNPAMVAILGAQPSANGFRGQLFGIDVFESTNVATANTAADRCGACLNPAVALAIGTAGGPETKVQEDIKKRTTLISTDIYYDVKEWVDGAGCKIVTDA